MRDARFSDFEASARNLFFHCAGCQPGDSVLLVHERETDGYYDPALVHDLARAAQGLGLHCERIGVPFRPVVTALEPDLADRIGTADVTVFLARLGDQIRFRPDHAGPRQIICYALDRAMFASRFGAADYRGFDTLCGLLNAAVAEASEIRVTCPLGTDFAGSSPHGTVAKDTTRKRFPISIPAPVPAGGFRGQVVQSGFLTGTGSHYYEPYACPLEAPLTVVIEGNRITGFDGEAHDVAAARAHYALVGETFGIDAAYVHSWHAGMHPGLSYGMFAGADTERWSGGAFGNPRILHLHTCGDYPPGEICLNVVDPTVTMDGVPVWEAGRLHPDRIAGGAALLDAHPDLAALFDTPSREIGLARDGRLRMTETT
jgi:hypothetical protein